jgi:hypothetical protein
MQVLQEQRSPFLTLSECRRLDELESVIGRGLKCFDEVGLALKEIHDKKLYRDQHATFEGYCRKRWNLSRIHGHRLIQAAGVAADLLPIGNNKLLTCESQARELVPLEPEMRRKVWEQVTAPGSPAPTAKRIRKVVLETTNGKGQRDRQRRRFDEVGGSKYTLRATVVVTFDPKIVPPTTDQREVEGLFRPGLVHWVLKNGRGKTLARAEVKTVESLERLLREGGVL